MLDICSSRDEVEVARLHKIKRGILLSFTYDFLQTTTTNYEEQQE